MGLLVDSKPKARTFNAQIPVHCASLDSWTASIAGLPLSNPTVTSTGVFPSAVGCLVIVSYILRTQSETLAYKDMAKHSVIEFFQNSEAARDYDVR